jgi:hypothetical protein
MTSRTMKMMADSSSFIMFLHPMFLREKKLFKPPNVCFYMSKVKLALSQMLG